MNLSTRIVRLQIITVVVGLAIDKAIGLVVPTPNLFDISTLAYFLITLLNFYHGKVAFAENENDDDTPEYVSPAVIVFDYFLNTFLMCSFLLCAYLLLKFPQFLLASVAMRVLDSVIVLLSITMLRRKNRHAGLAIRAHLYWLVYNIFTMAVLVAYALIYLHRPAGDPMAWMPISLTALGFADLMLDYAINTEFYFGRGGQASKALP